MNPRVMLKELKKYDGCRKVDFLSSSQTAKRDLGSRYLIKAFIFGLIEFLRIQYLDMDFFYFWIPDRVWDDGVRAIIFVDTQRLG